MLKNIRLHLEKDEDKQALLDDALAKNIVNTRNDSINAFQRNIPSLLPYVNDSQLTNFALFNNKFGEANIVDYGVGRTLYGFHPQEEISLQVSQALLSSPKVDLNQSSAHSVKVDDASIHSDFTQLTSFKIEQAQNPMPPEVECLIVLGCGLGLHIKQLLENRTIKHLIIYEPEIQYFQCSTMATSWSDIFSLAKEKGTALFIQLEKDGRDLLKDMAELKEHTGLSSFHIYKHYNHEVFDSIYRDISERNWQDICNNGFKITQTSNHLEYIPTWTPKMDLSSQSGVSPKSELFANNLKAFKKYFPNIYAEYKDYQPKIWLPIKNQANEINLLKAHGLYTWYGTSPKQDCILNFENFNEQPNKDGLILGYSGTKLAHYIHYQFVNETQDLLQEAQEEIGKLPETVASIIMFGLGVGYQLEKLLNNHKVEKLFVCEPNPDFFYASLFAIDWHAIFDKVEASDARIYLNVGDDGTHLFNDLLNQFHSIGPYILNNTYFYQSYYNASLNSAIAQLREQLQVVISMGEYFDHAYYGIEHMKEGFRRNYPVLVNAPASKLSYEDKEVPVFIVGNGPSLDMSIEAIKEWRDQAIVVSCGTALQALYKNGITPDFHAEIEQNRSTYDWPVFIGNLDYLKEITLISCNGIHPDTCELYKDVLIAFKEGESSTVSALSALGKEHFEVLQHSFPTVSNFVTNLISILGFNHIYLMGVDLGFVDVKHHHSKSSGYYQDNGKQTYDYSARNITSLVVPGNFRPKVNTKHEFKVSRQVIEQVIRGKSKEQTFYNCSDGAKIKGTTPLYIKNLLIVSPALQKQRTLQKITNIIFSTKNIKKFNEKFKIKFSHQILMDELVAFKKPLKNKILTSSDANNIITSQKEMLFSSYKNGNSLLFYFLYGTVNYANAVLTKTIYSQSINSFTPITFDKVIKKWLSSLQKIIATLEIQNINNFDTSSFKGVNRELLALKLHAKKERLLVVTDSIEFRNSIICAIESRYDWLTPFDILTPEESINYQHNPCYSIYYIKQKINQRIKGKTTTLVIADAAGALNESSSNVTYLAIAEEENNENHILDMAYVALKISQSAHQCVLIIPKNSSETKAARYQEKIEYAIQHDYIAYSYPMYVCLYRDESVNDKVLLSRNGSRGKRIIDSLQLRHFVY